MLRQPFTSSFQIYIRHGIVSHRKNHLAFLTKNLLIEYFINVIYLRELDCGQIKK